MFVGCRPSQNTDVDLERDDQQMSDKAAAEEEQLEPDESNFDIADEPDNVALELWSQESDGTQLERYDSSLSCSISTFVSSVLSRACVYGKGIFAFYKGLVSLHCVIDLLQIYDTICNVYVHIHSGGYRYCRREDDEV